MPADRSGPDSSAETLIAAAAWRAPQTANAGSAIRRGQEVAPAKSVADETCRRTGRTTSSRSIQLIGSAIGTETGTTFGMVTIAVSLTAPGSSLTSGFIHGGRIGIRTTTTATVITRAITTRTVTMAEIITGTRMNRRARRSPSLKSNWRGKVITAVRSTASLARKHAAPLRVIKVITAWK